MSLNLHKAVTFIECLHPVLMSCEVLLLCIKEGIEVLKTPCHLLSGQNILEN